MQSKYLSRVLAGSSECCSIFDMFLIEPLAGLGLFTKSFGNVGKFGNFPIKGINFLFGYIAIMLRCLNKFAVRCI
jgi:hypothetical protein